MKIKKVFIKNFKGIEDKKVIEFSNQTSIMTGPNGFGKTTIFDILELCLTGKINRTLGKAHVTKDTKDYIKPFYQNTIGEDVIIKIWIQKECKENIEDMVIVKFLSKDNDGKSDGKGRRNKPCDFELLSTYKQVLEDFDNDEFVPSDENKIDNHDINKFFGFDISQFKIENLYKLFNYLQQEDTTYFLKFSENERKSNLGFLFQTSEQEFELETINKLCSKLCNIETKLDEKIIEIKNNESLHKEDYIQLFPDKDFEFDKENIFEEIDLKTNGNKKELYFKELDKLSQFTNRFSPDEYIKKIKAEILTNSLKNQNLVDFYVLQNLAGKNHYGILGKEREVIDDKKCLEAYILQNCFQKYKDYQLTNKTHEEYEKFLKIKEYDIQLRELEKFVERIMPEKIEEYLNLKENRKIFMDTSNEIEQSIAEIIRYRNNIKDELEKNKHIIISDTSCPYCGNYWDSYEMMLLQFYQREESLKKLHTTQSSKLSDYDKSMKEKFIVPITEHMREFIKENNKVDSKILEVINEYKDLKFDFENIKSDTINTELIWSQPNTYMELKENVEILKNNIEQSLHVSKEVFNRIKNLYNISFEKDIKVLEEICPKKELIKCIISNDEKKKITISDVEINSKLLKNLFEKVKEEYKYEYDKTYDPDNTYQKYFNSEKEKFIKFDYNNIHLKKSYIEYKLLQKQNSLVYIYEGRKNKISNIIDKVKKLKDIYDQSIKNYKKDMVNKIKVPFYIYTAKILQNYQQGMGVFLSTKENSDSIRFLTDSSSDHDAMHHLSSGQLAVVSLAFCLAINKTYNISSNLKFLVIDDPIQDMDALNIHSFVELIRHEFIEDYQLIFSTHNDSHALYMKYKFEKMKRDSVKMLNVQDEFFV